MSLPRTHAELQTERERSWLTPRAKPSSLRKVEIEVTLAACVEIMVPDGEDRDSWTPTKKQVAEALMDQCFPGETTVGLAGMMKMVSVESIGHLV